MKNSNIKFGTIGEEMAIKYLNESQYKIVQKNYRCRFGEIDVIAYKDNTYIFIEVKTRRNLSYGRPIEAIDNKKRKHLLNVAQYYIQTKRLRNFDYRFDAIEIMILPNKVTEMNHVENILSMIQY